ncbi:hypothetical protein [Streptomyces sp. NBC_01353]|uniref:hypothetical protein n=1 Tax=Streptomyces sp. NBC_01353 TaxID=2903835 RepID=UPI002E32E320|nr:hypothetical protein [Streptomyces sp. NBC_01353]
MHADIHLQLHHLDAAELHRSAELHRAAVHSLPHTPVRAPVRARIGWTLVALGLRLAVPATARPGTSARRLPLAA